MTATPTQRALVVEDDPDIGELLVHYLQKAGFDKVANLAGGMLRWRANGHPVEGGRA